MEQIFRYISFAESPFMPNASGALRHFLDGTTSPSDLSLPPKTGPQAKVDIIE
jgi:hypothetical protein